MIRTSWFARLFGWTTMVTCSLLVALAVSWGLREGRVGDGVALAAMVSLLCLGVWWATVHPRILLYRDEIVVRNVVTTTRISWATVADCVPGYGGLTITELDGHCVTAFAVQKSNLSTWRNRSTRADRVAQCIKRRAESNLTD